MKSPEFDHKEAPDHYGAGASSLRDVAKMWPGDLGFTFQQVGNHLGRFLLHVGKHMGIQV